ncbi:MAG: hypothetical protein IJY30_02355 [Muribaculaceae bacterium]|nr:hypothetical protein [Muribaculaceae bacterium]
MAKYSSKPASVSAPVGDVYKSLTNIEAFQQRLDSIPEEQRKQIGDIKFTNDSITLNTPQVGELQFVVVERKENERLVFSAAKSPIPLTLAVNLNAKNETETEITSVIDVEIPAMLRPLIGGKLQEAADKFSELILTICNK